MEVTNIFEAKTYELTDEENVQVIKNCLDREGLQLINLFKMKRK